MPYQKFITVILEKSSKIANNYFGKISGTIKTKNSNQVLTETDIKIGKLIIDLIQKNYPKHNIIDEESGVIDHGSEYTWVVDPLDGTSNFAIGVPMYGIIIGLLQKAIPIAGGISLPYFSEICIAEKGGGAYCNGKKLAVNKETDLSRVLVAYGIDSHQENLNLTRQEVKLLGEIILHVRNLRTSNSIFDAVMVAKGKYGGWLNRNSKIWDNVGQQVIIEEAGGVYTDFFGNSMDYSNPLAKNKDNFTFCAAPPVLHKKLQEIIKKLP